MGLDDQVDSNDPNQQQQPPQLPSLAPQQPQITAPQTVQEAMQQRMQMPSLISDAQIQQHQDAMKNYEDMLRNSSSTGSLGQQLATALAASIPMLIGGATGGLQGAGFGAQGTIAGMKTAQDIQKDEADRQQKAAQLGFTRESSTLDNLQREKMQEALNKQQDLSHFGSLGLTQNFQDKERKDQQAFQQAEQSRGFGNQAALQSSALQNAKDLADYNSTLKNKRDDTPLDPTREAFVIAHQARQLNKTPEEVAAMHGDKPWTQSDFDDTLQMKDKANTFGEDLKQQGARLQQQKAIDAFLNSGVGKDLPEHAKRLDELQSALKADDVTTKMRAADFGATLFAKRVNDYTVKGLIPENYGNMIMDELNKVVAGGADRLTSAQIKAFDNMLKAGEADVQRKAQAQINALKTRRDSYKQFSDDEINNIANDYLSGLAPSGSSTDRGGF